jgi:hypothetical protein
VTATSGAVVTGKSSPIWFLLCWFCREDGWEYFYDNDLFECGLSWWRSNLKAAGRRNIIQKRKKKLVEGKQEFKYSLLLFEWCTKWPEQRWKLAVAARVCDCERGRVSQIYCSYWRERNWIVKKKIEWIIEVKKKRKR